MVLNVLTNHARDHHHAKDLGTNLSTAYFVTTLYNFNFADVSWQL